MRLRYASLTHRGMVRGNNQDFVGEFVRENRWALFLVADGMGGHQKGEVASNMAVNLFGEFFQREDREGSNPTETLLKIFREVNRSILLEGRRDPLTNGMGTTLTLLLVKGEKAWVGHIGDSRLYRIRTQRIEQLTQDHSVVCRLVRNGLLTPEQAKNHPQKNVIYQSLGLKEEINPDILSSLSLRPGDRFLLCSDGISNVLSDQELLRFSSQKDPQKAVSFLIEEANRRGSPDNVTVSLVDIEETVCEDQDITPLDSRAATIPHPPLAQKPHASLPSSLKYLLPLLVIVTFLASWALLRPLRHQEEKTARPVQRPPLPSPLLEKVGEATASLPNDLEGSALSESFRLFFFRQKRLFSLNLQEHNPQEVAVPSFSPLKGGDRPLLPLFRGEAPEYIVWTNPQGTALTLTNIQGKKLLSILPLTGESPLEFIKEGNTWRVAALTPPLQVLFIDEGLLVFRDAERLFLVQSWKKTPQEHIARHLCASCKVFFHRDSLFWTTGSGELRRIYTAGFDRGEHSLEQISLEHTVSLSGLLGILDRDPPLLLKGEETLDTRGRSFPYVEEICRFERFWTSPSGETLLGLTSEKKLYLLKFKLMNR